MSTIFEEIQQTAASIILDHYETEVPPEVMAIQVTKKEFEGDFTLIVFPLSKYRLGAPHQVGEVLGQQLVERVDFISDFNVIKGFLNLSFSDNFWLNFLGTTLEDEHFLQNDQGQGKTVVVEYCSPNTNKPLHLGHLRNIVLGYSLTQILQANGYKAIPTCLFNDRGTNISKSMYTWLESGKEETPEMAGIKGDKLVGDYYVAFSQKYGAEVGELLEKGIPKQEAEKQAPSMKAVHEMTVKWEEGDPATRALWKKMNSWVYDAYEDTFQRLGVKFDRYYYESEVYQRGRETVEEGLEKGIFSVTDDGAVEVDLTDVKLDKKTLLRSNGTTLYVTQDLAIAKDKFDEFQMDKSIYVVGNEQDYHFKALFAILDKLEKPYAKGLYHLSYGMVDLPSGKMKSREGTTVEADDLMDEMIQKAEQATLEQGKTDGMEADELKNLYQAIGLSALKYFLIKVDPKKRMLFDPNESVDIQGHTGPFIQYAYTRTAALKRKGEEVAAFDPNTPTEDPLHTNEKVLLRSIFRYKDILKETAESYNPALVANFAYELAKDFNRFYHGDKILQSAKPNTSAFRFALAGFVGDLLKESMRLLGIEMPERM